MITKRAFPVRPRPLSGESLKGYALRVTKRNGRRTLAQLNHLISARPRQSNYVILHPHCDSFLMKLAPFLRIPPDQLHRSFNYEDMELMYDRERGIQDIRIHNPKLCPQCILEQGFFHHDWQFIYITHCPEHQVPLIDHCPECNTELKWHCDLFHGCSNDDCDYHWRQYSAAAHIPTYQVSLSGLPLKSRYIQLRALLTATLFTFRPYDLIFRPLKTCHLSLTDMCQHLLQAHELLTNADFRTAWFSRYTDDPTFIPVYCETTLTHYLESQALEYCKNALQENIYSVSAKKHEISEAVIKPRIDVANSPRDLRYQVGITEASAYLCIPGPEVMKLNEMSQLRVLNEPRLLRDVLFDIRDLHTFNAKLYQRAKPIDSNESLADLLPLTELIKLGPFFHLKPARILSLLLSSEDLPLRRKNSTAMHWGELLTSTTAFIGLLESSYLELLPTRITAASFIKMTTLSISQLKALMHTFSLLYVGGMARKDFDSNTISDFFSRHVILNREAKLRNLPLEKLRKRLLNIGYEPSQALTARGSIYVYDSSPELLKAIERLSMLQSISE